MHTYTTYGSEVRASFGQRASVIAAPERAVAGNLILRIGRVNDDGTWSQTEYLVLSPAEAEAFLHACTQLMAEQS